MVDAKEKAKKKDSNPDLFELELKSSLDIAAASEFYNEMKNAANGEAKEVILDGSKVSRITTPCIQIILSAKKTFLDSGMKFSLKEPSEAIEDAFFDLGMEEELESICV